MHAACYRMLRSRGPAGSGRAERLPRSASASQHPTSPARPRTVNGVAVSHIPTVGAGKVRRLVPSGIRERQTLSGS